MKQQSSTVQQHYKWFSDNTADCVLRNNNGYTYPTEHGPDLGVEADGDAVQRPVQSAPAQPLSLPVRVHAVLQVVRRRAVQGQRAQLIHRLVYNTEKKRDQFLCLSVLEKGQIQRELFSAVSKEGAGF